LVLIFSHPGQSTPYHIISIKVLRHFSKACRKAAQLAAAVLTGSADKARPALEKQRE
jgi:hypothetical protein